MATDEGRTRTLAEWADQIAVGGLVLAGLLVSVCGPILRRRNETLRDELDQTRAELDAHMDERELGAEDQAAAPDVGAEGQAAGPDLATADYGDKAVLYPQAFANGQAAAADQGAELP